MRCDALRARLFEVSLPADNLSMLTSPPKRMMFLTVLLVVALAVMAGGCGSHTAPLAAYTDKPFGYTITYDKSRLDVPRTSPVTVKAATWWILPAGPRYTGEVSTAGVADRDRGDRIGGDGGGVTINSFSAARTIVPPSLASLRQGNVFFATFAGLKSPMHLIGDLAPRTVEPFTLDGLSGFSFSDVWHGGRWVTYALFDGSRMYLLECRASLADWPGIAPTLDAVVRSFRITN